MCECRERMDALEDAFADKVVVRLAADFFEQRAQQHKAVVGVSVFAAGLEGQRASAKEPHVVDMLFQGQAVAVELRTEDVAGAAGVSQ
jgi:hypothetical protein